jgi:hypothetical protein
MTWRPTSSSTEIYFPDTAGCYAKDVIDISSPPPPGVIDRRRSL